MAASPPLPEVFLLTEANFLRVFGLFLLGLVRVSGFLLNLPAFGEAVVPTRVKAGLSALMALLLLPHLAQTQTLPELAVPALGWAVARELVLGLALGFMVLLAIDTVKFAGELIGMQIGFAFVQVMDPESNRELAIIAELLQVLALLFFLLIDGHLWFLRSMADSFDLVPLTGLRLPGGAVAEIARSTAMVVRIGLQLAMPVFGCILVGDVALGIIARTVPRLNIFEVGFPIKIFLGFLLLILMSDRFGPLIRQLFKQAIGQIATLLRLMG